MSEELTVSSGLSGSGGSFMKNLGMYAHLAEISLIAGSAIYFYSRNAKLEARIAELEKKLNERTPAVVPSPEDRQKEMNDMANFIYHKLHQELHQEFEQKSSSSEGGKKKKKVRVEEYHEPEEIQVATTTSSEINDDIENELKKEM